MDFYQIWYILVILGMPSGLVFQFTFYIVRYLRLLYLLLFSGTYLVKCLIMKMNCHHPGDPGTNWDVKMWFTF